MPASEHKTISVMVCMGSAARRGKLLISQAKANDSSRAMDPFSSPISATLVFKPMCLQSYLSTHPYPVVHPRGDGLALPVAQQSQNQHLFQSHTKPKSWEVGKNLPAKGREDNAGVLH